MQTSHWHVFRHVCVPPEPQAWVVLAVQTPAPVQIAQAPQVPLVHVRDWVPQFPHACDVDPVQV